MVNPLARQNMKSYLKKEDIRVNYPDNNGVNSNYSNSQNNLNLDSKEHELIQNIIKSERKTNNISLDELVLRIKENR